MPICLICNFDGKDLSHHLKSSHQLSAEQYREKYGGIVIDPCVEEKRKSTCEKLYGDPNYKNEEAKKLSNEVYEGGHSLSDPLIREKANQTKTELYGDKNFTNREQAKQTCMTRYGVDNVGKVKSVVEKRNNTLMGRYGRIFNHDHIPLLTKEELIELHINQGKSLKEIGDKYGTSGEGISYYAKKYGIKINKKYIAPKDKKYVAPAITIREYLEECVKQSKFLSFGEFGTLTEDKKAQRLKRLFNAGKVYCHLYEELKQVALHPELWDDFLKKIDS